jgi:hypothetical protein
MAKDLSPVAKSLLTLLNNIDELIVRSHNRKDAREVMRALTVYANSKNYEIPDSKIEDFYAILLDGRPQTLSFIIKDIAGDIIKTGMK